MKVKLLNKIAAIGTDQLEAVYCHPTYLTYMQTTSYEMPGWMKLKLE